MSSVIEGQPEMARARALKWSFNRTNTSFNQLEPSRNRSPRLIRLWNWWCEPTVASPTRRRRRGTDVRDQSSTSLLRLVGWPILVVFLLPLLSRDQFPASSSGDICSAQNIYISQGKRKNIHLIGERERKDRSYILLIFTQLDVKRRWHYFAYSSSSSSLSGSFCADPNSMVDRRRLFKIVNNEDLRATCWKKTEGGRK